ncbi:glyceraldehyde-3-phosphate dehydrogenase [Frigidibacter sp. RF13]|nr:glyceraldehyde-3-phosphate dehydrogenase [Frigidibacter sp. RF13]MCY1127886.1 glyceraldehyde-3-phosphate dehydrogenase [Frigidibacter sp. RF13]
MTNRLALALAFLVILAFVTDRLLTQGAASLFVARKFLVFIDWIAFWR